MCMGSADAVLRDWQDNVIDRAPLPLLFNISGRGKQSAQPKRAQKRAIRGVPAQQHSWFSFRFNNLLEADNHTYLVAPGITTAVPLSVNPSVRDPRNLKII